MGYCNVTVLWLLRGCGIAVSQVCYHSEETCLAKRGSKGTSTRSVSRSHVLSLQPWMGLQPTVAGAPKPVTDIDAGPPLSAVSLGWGWGTPSAPVSHPSPLWASEHNPSSAPLTQRCSPGRSSCGQPTAASGSPGVRGHLRLASARPPCRLAPAPLSQGLGGRRGAWVWLQPPGPLAPFSKI